MDISNLNQTNQISQSNVEDSNQIQADLAVKALNYEIQNDAAHDRAENNDDDHPDEISRIQDEAS